MAMLWAWTRATKVAGKEYKSLTEGDSLSARAAQDLAADGLANFTKLASVSTARLATKSLRINPKIKG